MPHLAALLQAEDPGGHGVHEHSAYERHHADDAQGGMGNLPGVGPHLGPKVHAGKDEVGAQHDDVPHEGRAQVGVGEQLPQASRLPQVHHHQADGGHRAGDGAHDGHLGDAAEAGDAERLGDRRDDEAAGRQAHEEHEGGDVEAPRVQVAHAGLDHAARELHGPQRDARDHHRGRHADGDAQATAAPGDCFRTSCLLALCAVLSRTEVEVIINDGPRREIRHENLLEVGGRRNHAPPAISHDKEKRPKPGSTPTASSPLQEAAACTRAKQ